MTTPDQPQQTRLESGRFVPSVHRRRVERLLRTMQPGDEILYNDPQLLEAAGGCLQDRKIYCLVKRVRDHLRDQEQILIITRDADRLVRVRDDEVASVAGQRVNRAQSHARNGIAEVSCVRDLEGLDDQQKLEVQVTAARLAAVRVSASIEAERRLRTAVSQADNLRTTLPTIDVLRALSDNPSEGSEQTQ